MGERTIRKGCLYFYGDEDDGVIGIPGLTEDGKVIEISCFFGSVKPKPIIVVSSQVGCPLKCAFCELGWEKFVRNLTAREISDQVLLMRDCCKQSGVDGVDLDKAHKVTVANSGEPLLNPQLVDGLAFIDPPPASFKVSTVFPVSARARSVFDRLADFAAQQHPRTVQLQISLISTSQMQRSRVTGGHVAEFVAIRNAAESWRIKNPLGRKINLSLILTDDRLVEVAHVAAIFPPELFRFRFREYVPTEHGKSHALNRVSATRLAAIKESFLEQGYEVGDWGSPTSTEWRFGLTGNVIRYRYLNTI